MIEHHPTLFYLFSDNSKQETSGKSTYYKTFNPLPDYILYQQQEKKEN